MPHSPDSTRKFLFEHADIRGELAYLNHSLTEVLTLHQYAPAVGDILGQFLTAAVLLSTTIKFEGRLVLQAQSEGQIPLMMAECTNDQQIRGIARGAEEATATDFMQLFETGRLAITIEPLKGQRYQGIVPLTGSNLASCIEHYFETSEQLPTRLWLSGGLEHSAGLLLQQLPAQLVPDISQRQQQWEHVCTLADTIENIELSGLEAEQLLRRLYHQDPLQLFDRQLVGFGCSCSRQRCYDALSSMEPESILELMEDDEAISMDCEFCNQQYEFKRQDLAELLGNTPPTALH
jgi:molecular chaperone Hsp33